MTTYCPTHTAYVNRRVQRSRCAQSQLNRRVPSSCDETPIRDTTHTVPFSKVLDFCNSVPKMCERFGNAKHHQVKDLRGYPASAATDAQNPRTFATMSVFSPELQNPSPHSPALRAGSHLPGNHAPPIRRAARRKPAELRRAHLSHYARGVSFHNSASSSVATTAQPSTA